MLFCNCLEEPPGWYSVQRNSAGVKSRNSGEIFPRNFGGRISSGYNSAGFRGLNSVTVELCIPAKLAPLNSEFRQDGIFCEFPISSGRNSYAIQKSAGINYTK